jgi:thioredoxin-dependent peroxiredoxin
MLTVGDQAPQIDLTDEDGRAVALHSLLSRPVVLYFYPKDNTPGCTAEACAFRDAYEDFLDAGADVIGISSDNPRSHAGFRAKHRLPFRLMSDRVGAARRAFRIPRTLGVLPGRATFVIAAGGRIIYSYNSAFSPDQHVANALVALQLEQANLLGSAAG